MRIEKQDWLDLWSPTSRQAALSIWARIEDLKEKSLRDRELKNQTAERNKENEIEEDSGLPKYADVTNESVNGNHHDLFDGL